MSDFNLSKYLINESLQSHILYDEILNEKTNIFKILLPSHLATLQHSLYNSILKLEEKCRKCVNTLFFESCFNYVDDDIIDTKTTEFFAKRSNLLYNSIPDNEIKKINENYNKAINLIIKKGPNLLNRPHIEVIKEYINALKNISIPDFFNLTDSNFKKYTKALIKNIGGLPDGAIYFWFNSNKELLGLTDSAYIVFINPIFGNGKKRLPGTFDEIKELLKNPEIYIKKIVKIKLNNSDEYLTWPITKKCTEYYSFLLQLSCSEYTEDNYRRKKIGSPLSASSNIKKILGWGANLEDYVIVYRPTKSVDLENDYINDYVKNITQAYSASRRRNYLNSFDDIRYKWLENDIFQILPYRMNVNGYQYVTVYNEETQKFEVNKIKATTFLSDAYENNNGKCYFTTNHDKYAELCKINNHNRYKSLKSITEFNKQLKNTLTSIKETQAAVLEILSSNSMIIQQYREALKNKTKDVNTLINLNKQIFSKAFSLNEAINEITAKLIACEVRYDDTMEFLLKIKKNILNGKTDNSHLINRINEKLEYITKALSEIDKQISGYLAIAENVLKELNA